MIQICFKTLFPAVIFVILTVSCTKDIGNYEYKPSEVITITGIAESYIKSSAADKITIDPKVTASQSAADLEYFWGIYPVFPNASTPTSAIDTICRTKAIDYLVKQQAGNWRLIFWVRNKKTGYTQYAYSTIDVVTDFSRGWFVLKDDGSQSDVDLFTTSASSVNVLNKKMENVYSTINGRKLDGKASLFGFFDNYMSLVTDNSNVFKATRSLFILTDRDVSVVYMNTFQEIHDFNGLFIEMPKVKAPYAVMAGVQQSTFVNDGQVHTIYGSNIGLYSARKMKNMSDTPYKMSPYFFSHYIGNPYFFDELSGSFFFANPGNTLQPVSDQGGASNLNKTLLYMGYQSGGTTQTAVGYALFKDKTTPSVKTLSKITILPPGALGKMQLTSETLSPTDQIYNGTCYTLLGNASEFIYFAVGNNIWSRDLVNKTEKLECTLPLGEEVTFIRHRAYKPVTPAATAQEMNFAYDYVMIATKAGTNYKVRMFPRISASSGNLASEPALILEGNGSVGDVIYVSSSTVMSRSMYPNTY